MRTHPPPLAVSLAAPRKSSRTTKLSPSKPDPLQTEGFSLKTPGPVRGAFFLAAAKYQVSGARFQKSEARGQCWVGWSNSRANVIVCRLQKYVFPEIGKVPLEQVDPPLLLGVIPKEAIIDPSDGVKSARSARRGAQRDAGASGKRRNDADGRIWPTEGGIFAPAGLRYGPLVVSQTTARPMPRQQTRKCGQMGQ